MMTALVYLALLLLLIAAIGALAYVLFPSHLAAAAVAAERRMAGLTEREARIPGFRITYLDGGPKNESPEPPLVLIHGIGADKDNWTRVARYLTERYRVIAPDMPGFGDSDKPVDADYGIEAQVERLREFLQALGLPRVHLGGNSLGGGIAAMFAATYPQMVASLWLLAPAGVWSSEPSEMFRRVDAGEAPPLFARNAEEFDQVLSLVMSKQPFLPGVVRDWMAKRAAQNYELHNRIFRDLYRDRPALEPVVGRVTAPTLIVWGMQDRVLHYSGAKILESKIPHAESDVLPGIGHMPMIEAPRGCADLFLSFAARPLVQA